ncbi:hypothetical protein [Salimicrobium flavidum]|uniref:Uncharacterized protein n=1 Tax=Salimicrobium flavidum TaxID=570947 RepID=A0A1N7J6Q0_9BACI|nr:hypothetical protein [Salimicrobium flavidum]SIS45033.1 hypothetical protein SAMN05421687_10436 [Salimicrobium flavidum]
MNRCLYICKTFTYEKGNPGCSCHGVMKFRAGEKIELIGEPFFVDQMGWYIGVTKQGEEPFPMATEAIDDGYAKGVMRTFFDLELELNYHTYKIDEALENKEEELFHEHSAAYRKIKSMIAEPELVEEG